MKLSVFGLLAIVAAGPAAANTFAQTAATTTTAPSAQDKAISDRVAKRIAEEPGLKADAVNVKVENGVVTLSGNYWLAHEEEILNLVHNEEARGMGVNPLERIMDIRREGDSFVVTVPEKYHNGHEAHFAQVTENFLKYLRAGKLPEWEVTNMLTKYATIMQAYELSQ